MSDKTKSIIRKIMIVFLLIQPAFDMYMTLVGEKLDVFGYSIVTIIRMLVISSIALIFVIDSIKNKTNILQTKIFIGFMLLALVYLICHHLVITRTNGYFIQKGLYSFLTEANYIFRLTMPMILIYNFSIIKFNKKDIINILITVGVSVAVVILLSDLLGVGFISYDYDNTQISANFFSWFNNEHSFSYEELTCKGFFYSANQISILLSLTFIVTVYKMLKDNNWKLIGVLLTMTITMLIVGTRVGTYMPLLVSLFMIIFYLITSILYKKKVNSISIIAIILTVLVWFVFFLYAPQRNRQFADDIGKLSQSKIDELEQQGVLVRVEMLMKLLDNKNEMIKYLEISDNSKSMSNLQYMTKCKFLKDNFDYHYISSTYINTIYPYKDDPDFWLEVFEMPYGIKADNRGLEMLIAKRIQERDNNILKCFFGFGATPLNKRGFMIERDIIGHYYNIGIVGTILFIGPYFLVLILTIIKALKELVVLKKIRFGITNIFSIVMMIILILSYNSGHSLDEFIIFIYLALISSNILNNYVKDYNKRKGELKDA